MRKASAAQLTFATLGRDHVVAKSDAVVATSDHMVAFDEKVRRLCFKLWPQPTTAAQLSIAADITVRQAQRILSRKHGFSLPVYGHLMRGLHGEAFLDLMMDGAAPEWWREVGQERRISAVKRRKRALEQELRELEGGR